MKKSNVTIGAIAKEAGVGIGTVDRVLHNRGRVSEETRIKVQEIIDRLNYSPNRAAQILAKREACHIAVIYHCKETDYWNEVKIGIDKAEKEFSQYGIIIKRYILPEIDVDRQVEILDELIKGKCDGIALVPYYSQKVTDAINRAIEKGIPVVTFNNDEKCNRTCFVGQDLYQSGRTAGRIMAMAASPKGRVAALVPTVATMSALEQRLEGFFEVLKEYRKDIYFIGCKNISQDSEVTYKVSKELVKKDKVDAIYVSNVYVEIVANAIKDLGMSDQILIIGHDLTKGISKHLKEGTINVTIGQEPRVQGYKPIKILCDILLFNKWPEKDKYLTRIEIFVDENI